MIKYETKSKSPTRNLYSGIESLEDENVVSEETMRKESATILVVEDEEGIQDFVGFILKNSGYTIIKASNGLEALKSVRKYKSEINLLITDFYMPGMKGDELALKLQEWYSEIRVLYISGCGIEHIRQHGSVEEKINYVAKPFSVKHLLKKVKAVLDN